MSHPEDYCKLMTLCSRITGLTLTEVAAIAATGPRRYKSYPIKKRSGEDRIISQPSRELKMLQYVFLRNILSDCVVHDSATAYVQGRSIGENATRHAGARVILKTDFSDFFPSIKVRDWTAYVADHFPHWTASDVGFSSRVLFWGDGRSEPRCLSIGSPTSPMISNIVMYDFDRRIHEYCRKVGIKYTRYADDITFSSKDHIDAEAILTEVRASLRSLRYPQVRLNDKKTKLVSKKYAMRVTGLVLDNDGQVSLGRDRKRKISSLIHRHRTGLLPLERFSELRGLLAFANDVEPQFLFSMRRKYSSDLIDEIMRG